MTTNDLAREIGRCMFGGTTLSIAVAPGVPKAASRDGQLAAEFSRIGYLGSRP